MAENPGLSTDASELVDLRRRTADLEREKREKEQRVAELEDENRKLKTPSTPAEKAKKAWHEGATFFG